MANAWLYCIISLIITDIIFAFNPYTLRSCRSHTLFPLQYKTLEDGSSDIGNIFGDSSKIEKKVIAPILNKEEEVNVEESYAKNNITLPYEEKGDSPISLQRIANASIPNKSKKKELILSSTVAEKTSKESVDTTKNEQKSEILFSKMKSLWKRFRPSTRFRMQFGFATVGVLLITGQIVPWTRLMSLLKNWLSHRGFQGVAAMGRTVAYGWAVFVAYPRMLDRRAKEQRRNEYQKSIERRQTQLTRLSGQVIRLRQELMDIDKEIRAFRREVISLQAYAKEKDDPIVQEAIGAEMAQLAQLRSEKQASLTAARQVWTEVKSKSPPESWDLLHDSELLKPN
mmetsp:Transcript_4739/g.7335  ORF Transcript_4739/g.7335 Transcript_4739/m.7335 type:complete len:341 (-) Transcript_4739:228-1250(-)